MFMFYLLLFVSSSYYFYSILKMTSRNNIKIIAGAIVCHEAKLRGDVTIGAGTIMHPCAAVNAEAGPIIIGEKCLIEEQSKITHRVPFDREEQKNIPVLIIGSNNVFEVGCNVEACRIGDNNIFEAKCFVGNKVTVTNGCIIGAGCYVTEEQILPENTIIYGEKCLQREALCGPGQQTLQMDTLSKMLPNYHRIRKPNLKS